MADLGKRVQLAGGTSDIESLLVGMNRELRVDISNDSLRLHDGVKEGGYEFPNRDQLNALFQKRSLELDGFKFGAQEKGILVRTSPSTYRLRKFTVNEGEFSITNTRGTAGDFYITLLETITTSHIWAGEHEFTNPIEASGGVVGNVTGDLTGDSFGTHTGDSIGNLLGNANGDHVGTFTGDVDVSNGTITFAEGQIPLAALGDDVDLEFINRGIPYGGIIMWAGDEAGIPDSWALCDGENGTPDLRDRFVLGAGGTRPAHTVGGDNTAGITGTLESGGAHEHDLTIAGHVLTTAEMPGHEHHGGIGYNQTSIFTHGTVPADPPSPRMVDGSGTAGTIEGLTNNVGGDESHTHVGSTADLGGEHTHEITLDSVNLLPPYYALCYLMKIA